MKGEAKRGRKMEYIIERYKAAHPEEDGAPIEPHRIAPWAYENGLWNKPPVPPAEILRKEISRHLKNQFVEDPQERLVRKNHAVPIKVTTPDGVKRMSSWYGIFEAPREHMALSLQLRRRQTARDAIQLNLDLESYNDNNMYGVKLPPIDFDLNKDVAESKMPPEYRDEPPFGPTEDDEPPS